MAARLKKTLVKHEPHSAHGRTVNKHHKLHSFIEASVAERSLGLVTDKTTKKQDLLDLIIALLKT